MAGIAMHRYRFRWLPLLVLTPVAMPEILLGVSLLLFFRQVLDLTLGFFSILIAHITFSIGFVAVIVRARLAGMDESIFEAARDLGATPWVTFRRITLPLILPALVAGFLMSFTLSIDDFVITFFVAGVGVTTLPLQIYSMIKVAVTPEVNAVSTLLMALTLTLIARGHAPRARLCEGGSEASARRLALPCCLALPARGRGRGRALPLQLEQLHQRRHAARASRQRCGCRVKQDYYSDNEEMLAKLEAGAVGYDLLVPTGNAVESLIRREALRPLDKAKLPHLANVKPEFRESLVRPRQPLLGALRQHRSR